MLVLIWAVIISPIPLVASLWLCILLTSRPLLSLLPDSLQGEVDIHFDGFLGLKDSKVPFQAVSDIYSFAFISFQGDKKRCLLWRDSCDDTTYRQLLVRLKLKQER